MDQITMTKFNFLHFYAGASERKTAYALGYFSLLKVITPTITIHQIAV